MGILNVTPDSFSDGGDYLTSDDAVARAFEMIGEGAAIIDVGPESTRPGAEPVSAAEQIDRALPVIRAVRARNDRVALSIDTTLASVAAAALDAGADIVNDVSALRHDPAMVDVVVSASASVVLMHMRGTPADMQEDGGPHYRDVIGEVTAFLDERTRPLAEVGMAPPHPGDLPDNPRYSRCSARDARRPPQTRRALAQNHRKCRCHYRRPGIGRRGIPSCCPSPNCCARNSLRRQPSGGTS